MVEWSRMTPHTPTIKSVKDREFDIIEFINYVYVPEYKLAFIR